MSEQALASSNEKALLDALHDATSLLAGGGGTRSDVEFSGGLWRADSGVIKYSPDELLITLKAGTPMRELEAILQEKGQMLAAEPMDHRAILGTNGEPTIGGAIGMNADGPRRLRYGAIREAVLGLRFMDGQGEILRAGGVVMKNVTGLDITKFFVGSRGRLGLALDVNLKLLPRPREVRSISFELDLDEFRARALPLLREPLEITAAVYNGGRFYLRQEGAELGALQARVIDALGAANEEGDIWPGLRDWQPLAHCEEIWRVYLRPTQSADFARHFLDRHMILCGGLQVVVGAREDELNSTLPPHSFAICEKGERRGKRLPLQDNLHLRMAAKLRSLYDPHQKFGGINEGDHAH